MSTTTNTKDQTTTTLEESLITPKDERAGRTSLQLATDLWEKYLAPVVIRYHAGDCRTIIRRALGTFSFEEVEAWLAFITSPQQTKKAENVGAFVFCRVRDEPLGPFVDQFRREKSKQETTKDFAAARVLNRETRLVQDLVELAAEKLGRPVAPKRSGSLRDELEARPKWAAWREASAAWLREHEPRCEELATRWLEEARQAMEGLEDSAAYWAGVHGAARKAADAYEVER